MNPPAKLLTFAVCLLLVFGGGWALGRAVAPAVEEPPAPSTTTNPTTTTTATTPAVGHSTHGGS